MIILDDEVKQVIARKEVISATDTSFKESNMTGVWMIEYVHEHMSVSNNIRSRKWRKTQI